MHLRVARSHSRTVLSPPAEARMAPSGLKATAVTRLAWPGRSAIFLPAATSQSLISPTEEVPPAEASVLPSGLNATQ